LARPRFPRDLLKILWEHGEEEVDGEVLRTLRTASDHVRG